MTDLLIKNTRPMAGPKADIRIKGGRIAEIGPDIAPQGEPVEDAAGAIALPGFVEAHTHLDKSLIGWPWYHNDVGNELLDMIANERAVKKEWGIDPHVQSMRHALQTVAYGATVIRSHVDIDTEGKLRPLEGVMKTAELLSDVVEIETVAFPQSGLMIRDGTTDLMDQAMTMGADVVGGLDPCGVDRDPKGHLDFIFNLAEKHGKPIDIHLHEPGEMGAFSMEMILDRTEALSMAGQVTVSHAFCLGMPDPVRVAGLVERLARNDVRIMTTAPASSEAPAVMQLREAGIKVGAGNDGIRDTWGPYGNGDMLERAKFIGLRNNFRRDTEVALAFDVCSTGGAEAMNVEPPKLEVGARGDVVVVTGESLAHAVVTHAPRHLVVKAGKVTARNGAALAEAP